MKRSRFSEEQIISILKEHEAGVTVSDLCRKHGVSDASIYKWKAKFGGMDVSEAKRLRALEDENAKLKRMLADAMLDNVAIVVADWPSEDDIAEAGIGPDDTLFGLYSGIPLTQRTSSYGLVVPDKITIFQGPLEEACRTLADLEAEVRVTVIHEIAHHFGIGEERLRELGWA